MISTRKLRLKPAEDTDCSDELEKHPSLATVILFWQLGFPPRGFIRVIRKRLLSSGSTLADRHHGN